MLGRWSTASARAPLWTRLEAALPALVFLSTMGLFGAAATWKFDDTQRGVQTELQHSSERLIGEVEHRFQHAIYALKGARGLFATGQSVNRATFGRYVESLDQFHEFPGVRGFGFIQRVLPAQLDAFVAAERADGAPDFALRQLSEPSAADMYVVRFIETAQNNPGAMGLDIGSESQRRNALQRAVDSGQPSMTGSITLVQDQRQTPGVLLFVPVYAKGAHPGNASERRATLLGLLYAPIVVQELLAGLPDVVSGRLDVEIFDAVAQEPNVTRLYDSDMHRAPLDGPLASDATHTYSTRTSLSLLGRNLSVRVSSEAKFNAMIDNSAPWRIAGSGLLIATLMALYLRTKLRQQATVTTLVAQRTRELERERLRLQTLLETATDGIHILDAAGKLIEANPAFLKMLGLDASVVGRLRVSDWDVSGHAISDEFLRSLRATPSGKVFETQHKRSDGRLIDVEINACGLALDGEDLLYCASRDVTERNRDRSALEQSKLFKNAILDSIADGIVVLDGDGVIVAFNQSWVQFERHSALAAGSSHADTRLGDRYVAVCLSEAGNSTSDATAQTDIGIRAVLEGRLPGFTLEYACQSAQHKRWLRMSVTPMVYDGHRHAVVAHQDISQQRQLEQERSQAQRLLKDVADRVPGLLYQYCLRPDGTSYFPYASEGIHEIYGVSPQQALLDATSVFSAIHPDDHNEFVVSLLQSAHDLTPWIHEYRVMFSDGSTRWMLGNSLAQRQGDGGTIFHGFVHDVTERKRAELEILHYQTKLQEMVSEAMTKVNALSVELLTSEARERRQISEDLHDNLGQSLALVRFKLRSLTARDDGTEEDDAMGQLKDIALSVERAIQSVRSFTAQLWPPVLYKFGLRAALEWLAGEMEANNGLSVSLQLDRLASLDEVTSIFLFRAARELLNNVWKHAQVSRVELSASMDMERQMLVLRVADAGVGFDVEQMHKSSESNGFGLFSVSERIQLIGGTVHIESQPGRGTVVSILLPVASTPL